MKFTIKKPIRLIELFAGVGSQAMALRDIGADFEHWKAIEIDKYAVAKTITLLRFLMIIPCKFSKHDDITYTSMKQATVVNFGTKVASCVTQHYYKGVSNHLDNLVLVIRQRQENVCG